MRRRQIVPVGPRKWTKKVSRVTYNTGRDQRVPPLDFFRHCATFQIFSPSIFWSFATEWGSFLFPPIIMFVLSVYWVTQNRKLLISSSKMRDYIGKKCEHREKVSQLGNEHDEKQSNVFSKTVKKDYIFSSKSNYAGKFWPLLRDEVHDYCVLSAFDTLVETAWTFYTFL